MVEGGEDWIGAFPDDLRPEAVKIQREIEKQLQAELTRIYRVYSWMARYYQDRKSFAITAKTEYPDIAHWLFKLLDGKFQEVAVLERMAL
jgi:hypothetical protein